MNLFPCRTLLGEIVHVDLNLALKFSVRVENDAETGVSKVVVEARRNDQHSISLTELGRSGPHISAEQGSQRNWGPYLLLFFTWEGAVYGKEEVRLWSQTSFATPLCFCNQCSL